MGPRPLQYFATVLALAGVYFAAAKLGLSMAFLAEQVSPVWPPTGIALAAVLLLGYRVWPGIAIGAFISNVTANEPVATAAGIAAGNTLEALVATWLLNRVFEFDPALGRPADVIGLAVIASGFAPTVSATIGVVSLCLGGVQPWEASGALWWVWWLGDATGALVVTPAVLVWATWPRRPHPRRAAEAAALVVALAAVALVAFAAPLPWVTTDHPLEYAIFPFVVWAALRFGLRGATAVTFLASSIAIWGTLAGHGPFSRGPLHENLILLQTFMAAVAVTALLLGAALAERDVADRRRAIDLRVTHLLAESASLAEAGPRILREIGEELHWDVGAIWDVDRAAGVLRCAQVWRAPGRDLPNFVAASREAAFALGQGLPGRVWETGLPAWLPDVTDDENFPRAPLAVRDGLHGAFAFPIRLGPEVLGVIEFFSREVRRPDRRLLQTFVAIGSQVGQFVDRKRAEEAVREAGQRKDEFLAMLGHELRNPLAPIRNALQILKLPKTTPEQAAQMRSMMEGQVEHMIRLVDDLLDVSRIMRGRIELRPEPVDLGQVLARAIETARPVIESGGHELAVDLPADPVRLDADPVRLAQVFANLMNNAAKYTEGNGRIRVSAERDDGGVVVRVRDTGIGIPADVLPHVFDLFVQGNGSVALAQGGLGIGLTLVRRLVELHRGTVQALSDGPGRGSEFVVRLPVARNRPGEGGSEASSVPAAPRPAKRILVVDDNLDAAESLAMLLRMLGHEVRTAHDGRSVVPSVLEFRPHALLLDLGLPGKNGYEVAKELRADPQFTGLLIAAVTGYGQDEDRQKTREAGFDYHLVKPVEAAVVQGVLADPRFAAEAPAGVVQSARGASGSRLT